jgi:hypothetical protein
MTWTTNSGVETDTANDNTTTTYAIGLPPFGDEHCVVSDPKNPQPIVYGADGTDDDIVTNTYSETYERTAQTVWHVQTGGKAVPGLLNLCQFSGSATEIVSKRGPSANDKPIPYDQIAIGSMGNLLTNGIRYNLLPNDKDFDITPTVVGKNYYTFSVGGQKYCSYFEVFVDQPNPGTQITYSDTAGHAFFRFYSSAPNEVLASIYPDLLPYETNNWGFYPNGALCGQIGQLQNDNTHGQNVCRVFYIGYPNFIAGLTYVKKLHDTPPIYCIAVSSWGYSCVYAAKVAGYFAGITLPSVWLPQNFGAYILRQFPGPPNDYTPRYSQ